MMAYQLLGCKNIHESNIPKPTREKNLVTFSSIETAKKHEREMQAFKHK